MLENNCSESASRMSAMENSTKSAGDMLNKLTLSYNRYNNHLPPTVLYLVSFSKCFSTMIQVILGH
jgi:hypothetical protein